MDQAIIAFSGALASWLSQDLRSQWARWACLFGLVGQPFWFYATFVAEQWGMFAACFAFTIAWLRGFKNFWWKPLFASRPPAEAHGRPVPAGCGTPSSVAGKWLGTPNRYRQWPQRPKDEDSCQPSTKSSRQPASPTPSSRCT